MNLYKIYNDICNRGHERGTKRKKGFELHHIIPKSMNGTNDSSNLALLTPKEHYVVHHCLARTGNKKMQKAFWLMSNTRGFKLTSKQYNELKLNYTAWNKGIKSSEETKLKQRLSKLGKPSKLKGISLSEERKQIIKYNRQFQIQTEETKLKRRNTWLLKKLIHASIQT